MVFLSIKEVEEDDPEPSYFPFGDAETVKGSGREDGALSTNCNKCFYNACCEYLWGVYLAAVMKHYFGENHLIINKRDVYTILTTHLKCRLNIHSYEESSNSEVLRPTQITRIPTCIKEGCLGWVIKWI